MPPELEDYVCRQCPKYSVTEGGLLKKLFELEGKFDRQMDDLCPVDAGTYALRQRLCKWFSKVTQAQEFFARRLRHKHPAQDQNRQDKAKQWRNRQNIELIYFFFFEALLSSRALSLAMVLARFLRSFFIVLSSTN